MLKLDRILKSFSKVLKDLEKFDAQCMAKEKRLSVEADKLDSLARALQAEELDLISAKTKALKIADNVKKLIEPEFTEADKTLTGAN